jgi:hypothetical protein
LRVTVPLTGTSVGPDPQPELTSKAAATPAREHIARVINLDRSTRLLPLSNAESEPMPVLSRCRSQAEERADIDS